jgi:hypothetical protein
MNRLRNCAWIFLFAAGVIPNFGARAQNKQGTPSSTNADASAWEHRVTGKVLSAKGPLLQVETREKRQVKMDATEAIKSQRAYSYNPGIFITVYGAYDAKGVLHAQSIQRAKNLPAAWPPDL